MVADWARARAHGEDVLMLASRRAQVDALNRRARAQLVDAGLLGADQLHVGGRDFAVGDGVIAGRNDYRLGLLNGTRGVVTAIDELATLRQAVARSAAQEMASRSRRLRR